VAVNAAFRHIAFDALPLYRHELRIMARISRAQ